MGNVTSILVAVRSRKRGEKHKKHRSLLYSAFFAPLKSRAELFHALSNAFLHARLVSS